MSENIDIKKDEVLQGLPTSIEKVEMIVKSLDKHKADNIEVIAVRKLTSLADYFIIVSAGSTTKVKSLSDYVEVDLEEKGVYHARKEGYQTAQWVLLDYSDVIVHVFVEEARGFYDLERLWKDGEKVDFEEMIQN